MLSLVLSHPKQWRWNHSWGYLTALSGHRGPYECPSCCFPVYKAGKCWNVISWIWDESYPACKSWQVWSWGLPSCMRDWTSCHPLSPLWCQTLMVEVFTSSLSAVNSSISFQLYTVVCSNTRRGLVLCLALFVSQEKLAVIETSSNHCHVVCFGSQSRSLVLQQDFLDFLTELDQWIIK